MPQIIADVYPGYKPYDYKYVIHDYTLTPEEKQLDFFWLFQSWGESPEDNIDFIIQGPIKTYYTQYWVTCVEEAKVYCSQDPKNASKHHLFVLLFVYMNHLMYHPLKQDLVIPEWIACVNIRNVMKIFFPSLLWCATIGKECTDATFVSLARSSDLTLRWYTLTIWSYCLLTCQYTRCEQLLQVGYKPTGIDRKAARIVVAGIANEATVGENKRTNVALRTARSILLPKDTKHQQKWYQRERQPERLRKVHYQHDVLDMVGNFPVCRNQNRKKARRFFWQLHFYDMIEYLSQASQMIKSLGYRSDSSKHVFWWLDDYVCNETYVDEKKYSEKTSSYENA